MKIRIIKTWLQRDYKFVYRFQKKSIFGFWYCPHFNASGLFGYYGINDNPYSGFETAEIAEKLAKHWTAIEIPKVKFEIIKEFEC